MAQEGLKRRLTAIRTPTNYRSAMSNLIKKFRGHVVDATGDNLLAEFASVVDAINGAIELKLDAISNKLYFSIYTRSLLESQNDLVI